MSNNPMSNILIEIEKSQDYLNNNNYYIRRARSIEGGFSAMISIAEHKAVVTIGTALMKDMLEYDKQNKNIEKES